MFLIYPGFSIFSGAGTLTRRPVFEPLRVVDAAPGMASSPQTMAAAAAASVEAGNLPPGAVSVPCSPLTHPTATSALAKRVAAAIAAMANSGGGVVVVGIIQGAADTDRITDDPNFRAYDPDSVIKSCTDQLRSKYYPPFEVVSGGDAGLSTIPFYFLHAASKVVFATAAAAQLVFLRDALGSLQWKSGDVRVSMEPARGHAALSQDTCISLEVLLSAPAIAPPSSCMLSEVTRCPES